MRYYRTTGLIFTQMQELVRRVNGALEKPWSKRVGRPKSLGLYKAVEAACMYLRQNAAQEFIGDVRDTSQPTISRYLAILVPLVKSVLEEFVPSAADAIEVVKGRVVLVDGTLTPCWSYEEHQELWNKKHGTTGFNAQLISLLDGTAAWVSDPLPGKTHDAKAFKETGAADILKEAGGGFGDKGYQGTGLVTPKKKPKGDELTLSDKEYNSQISFALVTDLLDVEEYPALDLACCYPDRWGCETVIGHHKTDMGEGQPVLRSRDPEGVMQEMWALFAVYQAICRIIGIAVNAAGIPPARISFPHALAAATDTVAAFPPDQLDHALATFLLKILMPGFSVRDRPDRASPRKTKKGRRLPRPQARRAQRHQRHPQNPVPPALPMADNLKARPLGADGVHVNFVGSQDHLGGAPGQAVRV